MSLYNLKPLSLWLMLVKFQYDQDGANVQVNVRTSFLQEYTNI